MNLQSKFGYFIIMISQTLNIALCLYTARVPRAAVREDRPSVCHVLCLTE